MKTFRTPIKKGFTKLGLRPSNSSAINSELFTECKQVRVTEVGLEGYVPDVNDLLIPSRKFYNLVGGAEITIIRRWPFPQVFLTDVGVFIGATTGLYLITDPVVTGYPNITLSVYATGTIVWPWVCIPIPGVPAFTSGNKFVYYDSTLLAYTEVN